MKVYSLLTLGLLTFSCFGQYDDSLSVRWKRALANANKQQREYDEAYAAWQANEKHPKYFDLGVKGLAWAGLSRYLVGPWPLAGAVTGASTALLLRYYDSNVMTPKRIKAFKKRTPVYDYFTLGDTY